MAFEPVLNPEVPYVGEVDGGSLTPGKMVKIQGRVPADASRFAVNYQLGPGLNPRDDIAIHVSPRFAEGFITRNSIESMSWGPEENEGPMWIQPGQPFEIILLCEHNGYKIAINGRHFTEFAHRLPYEKVTHLVIDGEVEISSIFYETINIGPRPSAPPPDMPPVDVGPPPPGGLYPVLHIHGSDPPEKFGPPPGANDYNPPRAYGHQPQYQKSEEEDAFGSCLDKVGLAVGGLVAAGGVAAAMHAYNKNKHKHDGEEVDHEKSQATDNESGLGGLGALGAALASSLAGNAFQGDNKAFAQQGYPPQDSGSGMLGSILGALGGAGGQQQPSYHQQPQSDPLAGLGGLGSILGGVLGGGGGGHSPQPQYQPTGGYGGYPQGGGGGGGGNGGGNDLLGGLGGALLKSAMDGLSKHAHKSRNDGQDHSGGGGGGGHYSAPPPSFDAPPSHRPPSPPAPGGGKLTAAEISKGLGLGDDED